MTERKPPGVSFETWIDRQVREAMDRGEFDDLPGAGKPIPGIDRPHDDMWWVKEKLRRENVSMLPATLVLRKEAEEALSAASKAASELQELKDQFEITRRNIANRIEVDYRQALNREQMLQTDVASTKAESDRLNARSFEYHQ